jgi:hypothetical protein
LATSYSGSQKSEVWGQVLCPMPTRAPHVTEKGYKYFIRRFYDVCKSFSIVKKLFEFLFKFKLFTPPKLKKYDAFAQMI